METRLSTDEYEIVSERAWDQITKTLDLSAHPLVEVVA